MRYLIIIMLVTIISSCSDESNSKQVTTDQSVITKSFNHFDLVGTVVPLDDGQLTIIKNKDDKVIAITRSWCVDQQVSVQIARDTLMRTSEFKLIEYEISEVTVKLAGKDSVDVMMFLTKEYKDHMINYYKNELRKYTNQLKDSKKIDEFFNRN